jgi:hypothetical protein
MAPFLLKEGTQCIRRHISSATASTILDRILGTSSLEIVKTCVNVFEGGSERQRRVRDSNREGGIKGE